MLVTPRELRVLRAEGRAVVLAEPLEYRQLPGGRAIGVHSVDGMVVVELPRSIRELGRLIAASIPDPLGTSGDLFA